MKQSEIIKLNQPTAIEIAMEIALRNRQIYIAVIKDVASWILAGRPKLK